MFLLTADAKKSRSRIGILLPIIKLEFGGMASIILSKTPVSFIFFDVENISVLIFYICKSKYFKFLNLSEKIFCFSLTESIKLLMNTDSSDCIILNLREGSNTSANLFIANPFGLTTEKYSSSLGDVRGLPKCNAYLGVNIFLKDSLLKSAS